MKKKNLFLLPLIAVLGFGLIACDKTEEPVCPGDPSCDDPTPTSYTVRFVAYPTATPTDVPVNAGATVARPATNPTRQGYTFVDWYLNNSAYNFALPVNSNIELRGEWTVAIPDPDNVFPAGSTVDYSWTFAFSDFPKDDSKSYDAIINAAGTATAGTPAVKWNYEAAVFMGWQADRGIQIGASNNRGQVTPWNISATFPAGSKLVSYSVSTAGAAATVAGAVIVSFGDHSASFDIANNSTVVPNGNTGLSALGNKVNVALKSNDGAVYLKSISFQIVMPAA